MATTEEMVAQFPGFEGIVQKYLDYVKEVEELDGKLGVGDTAGSWWAEIKNRRTDAVQAAETIAKQIIELNDPEFRAAVAHHLSYNRDISKLHTDYAKENKPETSQSSLSDAERESLYAKRVEAQKAASGLYGAISTVHKDKLDVLPDCPSGLRGGVPGKREKIGRKLPVKCEEITWEIEDDNGVETFKNKGLAEIAKAIGYKTAGGVRRDLEAVFPDATPNPFTYTFNDNGNKKTIRGSWGANVVAEDDSSDDDEDLETGNSVDDVM